MSFKDDVQKELSKDNDDVTENLDEFYVPGAIKVYEKMLGTYHFKTISDPGTNLNEIYYFVQVYERAEEMIKREASRIYLNLWAEMLTKCKLYFDAIKAKTLTPTKNGMKYVGKVKNSLKKAIKDGPTVNDINEVLAGIRRASYVPFEQINPPTYTPCLNGLLNHATRKLEPFNPNLFYVWQVQANYLDRRVTLLDTPRFNYYLNSVYYPINIPMILAYGGYSLQPRFPRNKILIIAGRERMGKGVLARLFRGLNPKGYGTISFEKLLISDNRFVFQSVLGKNLLVDPEMKRVFRKGFTPDFANINKLFGSDTIDIERKGKDILDGISFAKGIFIGNLPLYGIDNAALIARSMIVRTKDSRDTAEVANLDKDILEHERDEIFTLLMQCQFALEDRNFIFPGEIDNNGGKGLVWDSSLHEHIERDMLGTLEYWDLLADPVKQFIDSEIQPGDEDALLAVDTAYDRFNEWCLDQGIPTPAKQTFTAKFTEYTLYKKKKVGSKGARYYAFVGCQLVETVKAQNQNKLDTTSDNLKLKYIGALWNTFKRVQLRSLSLSYWKNNSKACNTYICKEIVPKLDTAISDTTNETSTGSSDMKIGVQPFLSGARKENSEEEPREIQHD